MPGRCNHIPTGAEARRREAEGTAHALGFRQCGRLRAWRRGFLSSRQDGTPQNTRRRSQTRAGVSGL